VAEGVEYLPSKCKALSSNPSTTKKDKTKTKKCNMRFKLYKCFQMLKIITLPQLFFRIMPYIRALRGAVVSYYVKVTELRCEEIYVLLQI
jgi:hypothetical protein